MGAVYFGSLQHSLALLVPSLLTLYYQCDLRMICLLVLSRRMGFTNICKSLNWFSQLVSPVCQRSSVDRVLSFCLLTKKPSACSMGLVSLDCKAWIICLMILVIISASLYLCMSFLLAGHRSEWWCSFDVAPRV